MSLSLTGVSCQRLMVSYLNPTTDRSETKSLVEDADDGLLSDVFEIWKVTSPAYLFVDDRELHAQGSLADVRATAILRERSIAETSWRRVRAETESRRPSPRVLVENAQRLLALGEFDGLVESLLEARQKLSPDSRREVDEALAESYLQLAEERNCVCDHNDQSCIYPLRGRGVHRYDQPARDSFKIYQSLAQRYPDMAAYRWLAHLTEMLVKGEDVEPLGLVIAEPGIPVFTDIAAASGLVNPEKPRSAGGTIVDDFDGDGDFDVVLGAYLQTDDVIYYENTGGGDFVDRTAQAGLKGQFGAFRMNQSDYDNDGDLDLFIVRGGWVAPGRNSLLQNNGKGRFTDVTEWAGLATPRQSMASAWGDYNADGHVDLFVANLGVRDRCQLFRNNGDGSFSDVTRKVGIPGIRMASSASWGDFDNDGDADLYISVALGPNFLLRNEGGKRFVNVTLKSGVARPLISFPTWFFDYDNDGHLDLFGGGFCMVPEREFAALTGGTSGDAATELRLHRNRGESSGRFDDVTAEMGLDKVVSTMGGNFGDIDSDGYPDLYLGTGSPDLRHAVPNRLLVNRSGRGFVDAGSAARVGHLQKGHGIAFADFDRDGDQDIFANLGGAFPVDRFQPALFANPGNANRSLEVTLVGTKSNRSAIGARIEAKLSNGLSVHRHVISGGPFGASPLSQHVGMGTADRVLELVVRWPSGLREGFADVSVGKHYRLVEGTGSRKE